MINMLPRLTRKSTEYIDSRAGKDQPFFLYVPLGSPHTPIVPTPDWEGKSGLGKYGDFVMQTDNVVGEVSAALARNGMADNTLVVFIGDHGAQMARGKVTVYEGGMRVPTIAWWPERIPPGTESDAVTGMMDILPTFVNLAGGKLPADRKVDGGDRDTDP